MKMNIFSMATMRRLLPFVGAALLLALPARSAVPGITGGATNPVFNLTAQDAYIGQPDGRSIYSWGYGCASAPTGYLPTTIAGANCQSMQIPGPTLIVYEGDVVTVKLTNNLPVGAGNTSILFPGFTVTATGGSNGLLTQEAGHGATVTYTFKATTPGTRSYYSGTQGDLQVEMGLFGAIIVLPTNSSVLSTCNSSGTRAANLTVGTGTPTHEQDFTLASAAYDHPATCYDREYIFQFSEIDPRIHSQAEAQAANTCAISTGCMNITTENYHPAYFMINGRSMPDDMDPNYASEYPHQPYNGDPHMHPGDRTLLRIIGQGRWQHPFHEHGNHVRILARDGNLLVSQTDATQLAGPLLFTTTTTPGVAMDGIFYWTGKGLNWDVYGHGTKNGQVVDGSSCFPDANGYYTASSTPPAPLTATNYYEWCADHNKGLESAPFGQVADGGPMTLPDANYLTNGNWYGGSPYLGPGATVRAVGSTGTTPPSGTVANSPSSEAGYAFMWHSHNEREITTGNVFPGGMFMMMLVDSREFVIDETN